MRITVTSDDGKQSAYMEIDAPPETPKRLLEDVAEDMGWRPRITVTDAPAEPVDDGFKFKVGQRVRTNDKYWGFFKEKLEGAVVSICPPCVKLDCSESDINVAYLEPAEQP